MIKIEKLKSNTQLSLLITNIKNDMVEFNLPINTEYTHRFFVTDDSITIIFSALGTPIIRLEYNTSLNFAYIYKHLYYITRDSYITSEFERIIEHILTQCAD